MIQPCSPLRGPLPSAQVSSPLTPFPFEVYSASINVLKITAENSNMILSQAQQFAAEWVAAWNAHDIDAVLAHYADDFTMTTPMIRKLLGIPSGTLQGKRAVGDYWRAALRKIPDLQFSIIETTCGVDTVSIYYNAVLGRRAIETFFFNANGKVFKALATYNG